MGKYTLDTDFSLLNGPKAHNWILRFRDIAGAACWGICSSLRSMSTRWAWA